MAACSARAARWISGFKETAMAVDATMASAVTATNTATSSTNSTSSNTTIANNFQTFLTLLTTQLQNQNPLHPLDTTPFTQQPVQFASAEQPLRWSGGQSCSTDQIKRVVRAGSS